MFSFDNGLHRLDQDPSTIRFDLFFWCRRLVNLYHPYHYFILMILLSHRLLLVIGVGRTCYHSEGLPSRCAFYKDVIYLLRIYPLY